MLTLLAEEALQLPLGETDLRQDGPPKTAPPPQLDYVEAISKAIRR